MLYVPAGHLPEPRHTQEEYPNHPEHSGGTPSGQKRPGSQRCSNRASLLVPSSHQYRAEQFLFEHSLRLSARNVELYFPAGHPIPQYWPSEVFLVILSPKMPSPRTVSARPKTAKTDGPPMLTTATTTNCADSDCTGGQPSLRQGCTIYFNVGSDSSLTLYG